MTESPSSPVPRSTRHILAVGTFLILAAIIIASAAYFLLVRSDATPPTPVASPPEPGVQDVLSRLSALETNLIVLPGEVAEAREDISRVLTGLEKLDSTVAGLSQKPACPVVSVAQPRKRDPKPAIATEPALPAQRLLSVDTWNGRPSIVLQDPDGQVRFATDGEVTSRGRYQVVPDGVRVDAGNGPAALLRPQEP